MSGLASPAKGQWPTRHTAHVHAATVSTSRSSGPTKAAAAWWQDARPADRRIPSPTAEDTGRGSSSWRAWTSRTEEAGGAT
eukprot:8141548-Alexandrium_andersonii.AAC.1